MSNNQQTLDILTRARSLLENGWCQHSYAKDAEGEHTAYDSKTATSFCSLGSVHRAIRDLGYDNFTSGKAFDILYGLTSDDSVARFNDQPGRTREEVLEFFNKAIEKANDV